MRLSVYDSLLWFLPAAVREGERDDLRRALLSIGACWTTAVIAASIGSMQWIWGVWQAGLVCSVCLIASASLPFQVRRSGNWRAAARALCGLVWAATLGVAALTGGGLLSSFYYLVFAPALATILLGQRVGLVLGVAGVVAVSVLYALRVWGMEPAIAVEPELVLRSAIRDALIFNLALGALVAAYEWLHGWMLSDSARSERRYRALADYGPDRIVEIDEAGQILHRSALGGSAIATPTARAALAAIPREDWPLLLAAARQLASQNSIRVGPLRWIAGHQTRWFEASLTRLRDGREQRTLVVARDVTDRVALEAQLRQSQKMQAVGQLASGLAHDFNNLLMVVSGYREVIAARAGADPETHLAAKEIGRAIEQGSALTRRLVALSRPVAISRRVLDLNEVVRESAGMLRVLLGEGIELALELAPTARTVRADAGELEQILVNLVANARDALPEGGTVRISVGEHDGRVALAVQDDGIGIAPEVRERIFEPFFTTRSRGHGTGLGLYVVYSIVTDLRGEIELHSELGAGTRFVIDLPAAGGYAGEEEITRRNVLETRGDEQVLVVEDRAELRHLVRRALEKAGYRVIVAADGIEALALSEREAIDLVLTDVVMPRMGGVALLERLRAQRPELRALFMSGYPEPDRGLDPRDPVLRKPFLLDDLLVAVRAALDAEGPGQ